mmetsp:Transcript_14375/g.42774  ORF Transcript_14375/g.42774 Transcript_14375/m.42774 type:complete len:196 (-) Transcript_14375:44-631(-)
MASFFTPLGGSSASLSSSAAGKRAGEEGSPRASIDQQEAPKLPGETALWPRSVGPTRLLMGVLGKQRRIGGIVWYPMHVVDHCEDRYFLKRFNDFRLLDQALRQRCLPGMILPDLPEAAGRFGLRRTLDAANFQAKRRRGLQDYLDAVLAQVQSVATIPDIAEFLGPHAEDRIFHDTGASGGAAGRLMTLGEFIG